eukprot:TRINITY_DN994_c0_g1_i1.p1 TRINITY_DN994_c0_g1~~TRINITY_DN994_c0_g1_i1.p1  ORF type:complete len:229 (-),score=35.28 TRINITY_DN994_c0_g1_i1:20-706(-)
MLAFALLVTFLTDATAQQTVPTKPPAEVTSTAAPPKPLIAVTSTMVPKEVTAIPSNTSQGNTSDMPKTESPTKPPMLSCKVSADCGKAPSSECGFDCSSGMCRMWCEGATLSPSPSSPPRPLANGSAPERVDSTTPVMNTMSGDPSTSSLKCIDIKAAYQEQNCCTNPTGRFTLPMKRRLLDHSEILGQIEAGLTQMRQTGGAAEAQMLAREVLDFLAPYAATQDAVP